MLPVKSQAKSPVKVQSALRRAVKRFREQSAAAALQQEQAVTIQNIVSNELLILARCARTGRSYGTVYLRSPEDRKFGPLSQTRFIQSETAGFAGQAHGAMRIEVAPSEFRSWRHWACPWCETKVVHSEIRCSRCGQWTCTGRSYVDHDGEFIFVCREECGARAGLGGDFVERIEASAPAPERGKTKTMKAVPHEKRALPTCQNRPVIGITSGKGNG